MTATENTVAAPAANQSPITPTTEASGQMQLPAVAGPTAEQLAALAAAKKAEQEAKINTSLARFDSTFALELQVPGQEAAERAARKATHKKAAKSGKVTLSLLPLKSKDGDSMDSVAKLIHGRSLSKEELVAFHRMEADKLKNQGAQLVTRFNGDNSWTGLDYSLSAKGDVFTLRLKKAEPIGVSLTKEPTNEELAKLLGISVDAVIAMKAEAKRKFEEAQKAKETPPLPGTEAPKEPTAEEIKAKEQALKDEEAQKALDEEAAEISRSASQNGEADIKE